MLKLTAFAAACACARAFSPANSPTMGLRTLSRRVMMSAKGAHRNPQPLLSLWLRIIAD